MKAYVKKTIRSDKECEKTTLIQNTNYDDYEEMKKQYGYIRLINDDGFMVEEYDLTVMINKYIFVDDSKDPSHAIRYTDYDGVIKIRCFDYVLDGVKVFIEPFNNSYIAINNEYDYKYKIEDRKIYISKIDLKDNWFDVEDSRKVEYNLKEKGYKLHKKLVSSIEKLNIRKEVKDKLLDICSIK